MPPRACGDRDSAASSGDRVARGAPIRIWIETIRDVEPGEELTYDYAYVLEERHTPAAKRRFPVGAGRRRAAGRYWRRSGRRGSVTDMRPRLTAWLLLVLAATTSACIPWPRRTYQVAPAFAGEIRSRDGAAMAGVPLLVSSTNDCSRPIARSTSDSAGRFLFARAQRSTHWLLLIPFEFPRTAYALCAGPADSLKVVDSGWLPLTSKLTALPARSLSCLQYVWESHTIVACHDSAKAR